MTSRCPDCGHLTDLELCMSCAEVASSLGVSVDERLGMLGVLRGVA